MTAPSSAAARPPAARRERAPWTLRRRLVATVVALLLGTAAVLALTSTLALRTALITELDDQLLAASRRSEDAPRDDGNFARPTPPESTVAQPPDGGFADGETSAPPPFLAVAGQRTGTLGMLSRDGRVQDAGYLDADAEVQVLDAEQEALLLEVPADETPRTVDLPGLGEFRVVAHELPAGEVLLTGLALAEVGATERTYLAILAAVVGLGLLVAGTVAAFVVRRSLRPLDRMAATARRVSETPLHQGEVTIGERLDPADTDARTEVGQVGAALNRMLGHVEAALAARQASETQVRQFVADASHELRTPLASIRGYAELVRRSPEEVPEPVRRALERVESESVRMSALVDDLLLLARLDAGRPLEREEVDLVALAVDALADAHAAGPGHAWLLDVPEEGAVVVGDVARLHQVLANLLTNARVHTPEGTTVVLRVRASSREGVSGVTVDVHDDGPGVAADLQPLLFQRFSRGDGARSRTGGSTGLGLAIVEAVVSAHRGAIGVESSPGSTTFSVWLPRLPDPPHDGAHAGALELADASVV